MIAVWLAWMGPASAGETIEVPGDWPNLTSAMNHVAPGDSILLGKGTFDLGAASVTVPLVGRGPATVLVRTSGSGAVLSTDDALVDLAYLTVRGEGRRAIEVVDADVRLRSVTLEDGLSGPGDGGLVHLQGGSAVLDDVVLEGASVTGRGGLLYGHDVATTVTGGVWRHGSADEGGAAWLELGGLVVSGLRVEANEARVASGIQLTNLPAGLAQTALVGNVAVDDGGAVRVDGGVLELIDAAVEGNSGGAEGPGGVDVVAGALALTGGRFTGNIGSRGGGGRCGVAVTSCTIDGGVFEQNASALGAGWHLRTEARWTRNLFCDPVSATHGGAVFVGSGVTASGEANVYVRGRASEGGAVYVDDGTVLLRHETFVGGEATFGAAAMVSSGALTLVNSLVALHAGGEALDDGGGPVSTTTNLFWANGGGDATFALDSTDLLGPDPRVANLSSPSCDRGDYLPQPGSPLIDAGSGPSEADGTAPDIGAFGGAIGAGADRDGDGVIDDDDCDPDDAATGRRTVVYDDQDGDGYGDSRTAALGCPGSDGVAQGGDCDDGEPGVHPDQAETMGNGIDDDCDGVIDKALLLPWYADADGDGFGDPGTETWSIEAPTGTVADATDCDDARADVNPAALELCDGFTDEDCDGLVDDADPDVEGRVTVFTDADGDGFGDASTASLACGPGEGQVSSPGDCDDAAAAVSPAAEEVCDGAGVDEDCDGLVDDADPSVTGQQDVVVDADGDGFAGSARSARACQPADLPRGDCDDQDPRRHPGAVDTPDDGVDQDCSGEDAAFIYRRGGCGCQGAAGLGGAAPGGSAGAVLLAWVLAGRRRRPPRTLSRAR